MEFYKLSGLQDLCLVKFTYPIKYNSSWWLITKLKVFPVFLDESTILAKEKGYIDFRIQTGLYGLLHNRGLIWLKVCFQGLEKWISQVFF
jgi:uncharacterized membrane protein